MAERSMRAAEHFASETARPEPAAQLVRPKQPARGGWLLDGRIRNRSPCCVAAVALQRLSERSDRRIPIAGRLREYSSEHHVDPLRKFGTHLRRQRGRRRNQRRHQLPCIRVFERWTPRQELVRDDAEAV